MLNRIMYIFSGENLITKQDYVYFPGETLITKQDYTYF